jgi:serine/threonine protein kinase
VELKEVINDENSPNLFLIIQYLEGLSLDRMDMKPTDTEVWKWSRQLISALYMCHIQAKVAHQDIKPENFKLSGTNKDLVLYDFGESKCFDDDEDDLVTRT